MSDDTNISSDNSAGSRFKRALERYKRDSPENWRRHVDHPEVSLDSYVKAQKLALGQKVAKKRRIYLDTKYWIYCLDALSGKPQRPIHKNIADKLAAMVQDGDTICPAHYALFDEIGRIGRADRRIEMARLVDWLSGKVTIVPPEIQMQAELVFLIRSFSHKKDDLYPALYMVWDPISSILGRAVPSIPSLPADTRTAFQKDWCDFLSVFGLEDFFECATNKLPAPNREDSDFCERQNEGAEAHRRDYKTFDEVFLIEIHGVLDALRPAIASAFHYLYTASGGRLSQEDIASISDDVYVKQFCGIIHEAYNQKKLSTQWPSLHIGAGIHAAKRYEQRLYQKGDWLDALHAQAALPYCDVFLTERALGTLITGKYLGFDKAYACKVVWRDEDVLPALTHGS